MTLNKPLAIALLGSVILSSPLFAPPIEEVFPKAFGRSMGIRVSPKKIADIDVYAIDEFGAGSKRDHWDARPEGSKITSLVLHYTVCDFPTTLNLFTQDIPDGRVSAHYVIAQREDTHGLRGGELVQVVPELNRAWHAGVSGWRGVKNLNTTSIGIEHVNQGFAENSSTRAITWFPFDPQQIRASGPLCQDIIKRHGISPRNVIGHADITGRKQDPGILFPWGELYKTYKVGAWLEPEELNPDAIVKLYSAKEKLPKGTNDAFFIATLRAYGYDVSESAYITPENVWAVTAFRAHFSKNQKPEAYAVPIVSGKYVIDEQDMLWAYGLLSKYSYLEERTGKEEGKAGDKKEEGKKGGS